MEREERIKKLEQFKEALVGWAFNTHDPEKQSRLRTYINHNKIWADHLARRGTTVEFDLKDYPVIFFSGLRQLKDSLEKRLRSLADRKN